MKKTTAKVSEYLRPEYNLDYSKAQPNRFSGQIADRVVVVDVSEVFMTPASVNAALISAMPGEHRKKTSHAIRE